MSVPSFRRGENKLQALSDTIKVASYTIHMCENDKIFPKKSRWSMCNRIIDKCLQSVVHIRQANKIKIVNEKSYRERNDLQFAVLLDFEALWAMMDVAFETYSIPSDKIDIWCSLMLTASERVAAWRQGDTNKYKRMNKNNE